jgi:YidC/Oxa1 family membrane protein insertase
MVVGFALVVAILVGWQMLFKPRPRIQSQASAPAAETARQVSESVDTRLPEPLPTLKPLLPQAGLVPETTVVLENRVMRLELSNVGGTVRSCWLKQYAAELVPPGGALLGTELLLATGAYSLAAVSMQTAAHDSGVSFRLQLDSITLSKTFRLGPDYDLEYRVEATGPVLGLTLDASDGIAFTEKNMREATAHYHFYSHNGRKLAQIHAGKLRKPRAEAEHPDWVALKSKYFLLALVCKGGSFDSTCARADSAGRVGFSAARRGTGGVFTVYLGPIEYGRLRSYSLGLENVVGLGWTKPVALAMLWFLRLLYSVVRNWGVAIIIFSILVKAAFYPLTRTQTRQMRQMQLLQPKLNELKVKYKDDAQKLNQETMQLYRLYKVNPMSGCLPLLVQLPVFWALYAVLRNSIELRGAGLGLWLKDLSEPDMLFGHLPAGLPMVGGSAVGLLPVLMGVSFIAQNLLTSADKRNWALTIIFPVFITLIFLNMPSGLQLYWFIYNVLSIAESMIALKGGMLWRRPRVRTAPAPTAR